MSKLQLLTKTDISKLAKARPDKGGKRLSHDGGGLYFRVAESKSADPGKQDDLICGWVFRYQDFAGKTREMGLGAFPDVDLTRAREKAREARQHKDAMTDPLAAKRTQRNALKLQQARQTTFRQCGEAFLRQYEKRLKSAVHRQQWHNTLDQYVYPVIGKISAHDIDTALVLKVLQQPWKRGEEEQELWTATPESARRIRGRIEMILDWARLHGHRDGDNPARWEGHLEHALGSNMKKERRHHPALPWKQLPDFIVKLRAQADVSALALEFTILCCTRTGETIGANWAEIDLTAATWTIPGDRMKAGLDHRVPLSPDAIAVLRKLEKLTGGTGYVFPGRDRDAALSNMAMLKKLERLGYPDLTTHGFRSTFRDWVSQTRRADDDLAELALAHIESNKTKSAYARSDLLEERRPLMKAWANWCAGKATAKLVSWRRSA